MKTRGDTTATLVSSNRSFTRGVGWRTVLVYEGLKNSIYGLQARLEPEADDLQPRDNDDGLTAQLTVTYNSPMDGSEETPEVLWEFPSNEVQNDILSHPCTNGMPHSVKEILKAVRDGTITPRKPDSLYAMLGERNALEYESVEDDADISAVLGDDESGTALELLKLYLSGVETWFDSQTVARVTSLCSDSYALSASRSMTGKIYSTDDFETLMNPPTDLRYTLPDGSEDAPDCLIWGWLGKAPEATQQADGRWQIVQEFWYGLWSTLLYEEYTAPPA